MQAIDAAAIETGGIPRLLLMDHAGLAVARMVQRLLPAPPRESITVCCGSGYNGGDGLAAARHLHDWGYALRVLLGASKDRLREEPAVFANILRRLGLPCMEVLSAEAVAALHPPLAHSALLIDALLGIGIREAVREPFASLIDAMNRSGRPIIAVDVPSGLDADTGCVHGVAVKATCTVTFGRVKHGCVVADGPSRTGSLHVDSITIPRTLLT